MYYSRAVCLVSLEMAVIAAHLTLFCFSAPRTGGQERPFPAGGLLSSRINGSKNKRGRGIGLNTEIYSNI